jgi:hypothetical protein
MECSLKIICSEVINLSQVTRHVFGVTPKCSHKSSLDTNVKRSDRLKTLTVVWHRWADNIVTVGSGKIQQPGAVH